MIASWVERLLELQKIDLEIRGMRLRLTLIPKEKIKLTEELNAAEAVIKQAREKVRRCELAIKAAESGMAQQEAHIAKLQQQSALVKKNTEYQAMLAEIETCRGKIGDLESDCLTAMDDLEVAQKELKELTREKEAEISNRRTDLEELTEVEAELAAEIKRQTQLREGPRKSINGDVLNRYEQIMNRNTGIPLAEIKEGVCSNCRLRLTPQTMSDAKHGRVAYCDNCMHLVYLDVQEAE